MRLGRREGLVQRSSIMRGESCPSPSESGPRPDSGYRPDHSCRGQSRTRFDVWRPSHGARVGARRETRTIGRAIAPIFVIVTLGLTWRRRHRLTRLGNQLGGTFVAASHRMSWINGPAWRHGEILLLSDIVLAAGTAAFQDSAHFPNGLVPGDGMHIVMPLLLVHPDPGRAALSLACRGSGRRCAGHPCPEGPARC